MDIRELLEVMGMVTTWFLPFGTTSVYICQTHQIVSIRYVPFVLISMRSIKWKKKRFDSKLNKDYVNPLPMQETQEMQV